MLKMLLLVAAGGAIGAVGRHLTAVGAAALMGHGFPYGTLVVNVTGSFALGALTETMALAWPASQEARAFLAVGVLGAFTTFSAFSLDVVAQIERGAFAAAAFYVLSSVALSVLGLFAGLRAMRMALT